MKIRQYGVLYMDETDAIHSGVAFATVCCAVGRAIGIYSRRLWAESVLDEKSM